MSHAQDLDDPSPLARAFAASGLTLKQVGERLNPPCCESAVSRYLSGHRAAPGQLYLIIGAQHLLAQQEAWRERVGRKKRRGFVAMTIETRLPAGVTQDEAREACVAALSGLRRRRP